MLSYYKCTDNLKTIKSIIAYYIKYSLMSSLRVKHRLNKTEFNNRYGDPIAYKYHRGGKVSFLDNKEIFNVRKEFLKNIKPNPFNDTPIIIVRLARATINQGRYAVEGCGGT